MRFPYRRPIPTMPSLPRPPRHPGVPDFTEAIAAAQSRPAAWGTPTNGHAQAALAALSEAVSAARAAQNTAQFVGLLATLRALGQRAEAEALAAAQDFEAQPTLAQDAATAQGAAAALQELSAGVVQAISQSAAFTLREAVDIPLIVRTITLRGSNLSAEALIQIDRQDLPFRMLQQFGRQACSRHPRPRHRYSDLRQRAAAHHRSCEPGRIRPGAISNLVWHQGDAYLHADQS